GHRRLDAIWQQYRPTFAGMLAVTNAEDQDLAPTFDDHVDLLRTVRSGDLGRALALVEEHLEGSHRRMLAAYARCVAAPWPHPAPSPEVTTGAPHHALSRSPRQRSCHDMNRPSPRLLPAGAAVAATALTLSACSGGQSAAGGDEYPSDDV